MESNSRIIQSTYDLTSFSYFQRSTYQDFMNFTSELLATRTDENTRSTVAEKEYVCHVYVRQDHLTGVILSDVDYPARVAQTLITKIMEEFIGIYPPHTWSGMNKDSLQWKKLQEYMAGYQDPTADPMMKLENDLVDVKTILSGTITKLLERGEKLDDLVDRSISLSQQSKMFYSTAKKTNRCCSLV